MEQAITLDDDATPLNEAGSPFDIWRAIFGNAWLLGAVLAIVSSLLESVGLIFQKKAQYKCMGDNVAPTDPKPSRLQVMRKGAFWLGVILYLLSSPVNMLAQKYAPETTVLPLNACIVVVNALLSFVVLYERFTQSDVFASVVCIFGAVAINTAMSQTLPGQLDNFPVQEVLQISNDLLTNPGFTIYMMAWLVLFAMCVYVVTFVSMQSAAKPFAVPMLVGLLSALFHFMSKLMITLVMRSSDPEVWSDPVTMKVIAFTTVLYILYVWSMVEGLQQLSSRFFVPAMFVACQVLTATQDLLFFRAWEAMTQKDISVFVVASLVSLVGVAFISPEQRVNASPDASGLNTPLLSPRTDAVRLHQNVLNIMDEYKIRQPTSPDAVGLATIDMSIPVTNWWRVFPILICIAMVSLPVVLWCTDRLFAMFTVLTLFAGYQGWKLGMHIALFAYVGTKKMAHFDNADFSALYKAEMKDPKTRGASFPRWEDVYHFVVLPNYKEDVEVLRLAIKSIAASGEARSKIFLVLAMEAREEGAEEKAAGIKREFANDFLSVEMTFHPVGLPGEVPGKSANTKWSAEKVLTEIIPARKINLAHSIFTVGDADSEFHSEYFAALTYYFVHAGGGPGMTPDRYLTIWQPPILHYKNYMTQPSLVRIASYLTSGHELANLADPNTTRVPYSTYSISGTLAAKVRGWDPDWISEDWHMALKCFLATGGRLKIAPIFLPILNYAPEGESWWRTLMARWVQAKRHALGFSELVYLNDHIPRVFRAIEDRRERCIFAWRLFFLWVKLLMIHMFMACFPFIGPMNGILLAYFVTHQLDSALTINSWTFLINCVIQAVGVLSMLGIFILSVVIFESVKPRIDNSAKGGLWWKSPTLHFLTVIPASIAFLPAFFVLAGAAEWVAAVKCARTHKFDYAVAEKKVAVVDP